MYIWHLYVIVYLKYYDFTVNMTYIDNTDNNDDDVNDNTDNNGDDDNNNKLLSHS